MGATSGDTQKKGNLANAGGLVFLPGDDGAYGGYGGTLSFGYRANLDKNFSVELAPVLNLVKTSHTAGMLPVAGFVVSLYYSGALRK